MRRLSNNLVRILGVCFVALTAGAHAAEMLAPLSLPRLGAGAPVGWRAKLEQCDWRVSEAAGPFGAGCAELVLGADGRVELDSPARTLPGDQPVLGLVWARAAGPGAHVQITLRDNRSDDKLATAEADVADGAWQAIQFRLPALPEKASGECYAELSVRGKNTNVLLDTLWIGLCAAEELADARPPVLPCAAALTPATPWGVVTGNAALEVNARVAGAIPAGALLRVQVVGVNGATFEAPPVALREGTQWSGAVTLDNPAAAGFGMYRAVATVTDAQGGALSAQVETLISRAPEPVPGPRADSPFGAHIRLQGPDLSAAAKLGYKWLRIHDASGITKWGIAEPAPGKWVWEDEQVALARKNGFSILGMLDGSPAWESGVEDSGYFSIYGAPRNVENWRNYVREMTGHYAGRIDAWEVWNEPWDVGRFFQGGTPLYYRELLEIAYTEAKLRNPACTIVGVDTYPPIWEKMVLSSGAYPFYDVLSWHRYDPNLHAWPGDAIARVADRINTEQAKHGTPKPLMCSEGGPDVGRFHGSFFSFADPAVVGDWSRGVDQFARMYLSMIAAGNQRFFAYTLHTDPRHGQRIQALTEPGIVLKPMHLGLAALAHFVEGARYVERLRPCADISAHVFAQGETRPYAASPSTVVVLHADGEAAEALPVALPATARAFDRWGNAMVLPTHATRGLGFLVAEGDAGAALLAALRGDAGAVAPLARTQRLPAVDALVDTWLAACASGAPLWPFFSTQGAAAVISLPHRAVVADRAQLREDAGVAEAFSALAGFSRGTAALREAGPFAVGVVELRRADGAAFPMAISVAFDGPGGAPRFLSMAAQLAPADTAAAGDAEAMVRKWETVFKEGTTTVLRDVFRAGVSLLAVSTANGEYFVFDTPDYLRTMLDTAVMWGKAIRSAMSFEAVHVDANTAMLYGEWDLASLSLGAGRNPFTATLLRGPEGWRFVSLTFGAPVM